VITCRVAQVVFGRQQPFHSFSQLISLVPGTTGAFVRRAFYRWIATRCAPGSWIGFGTVFSHPTCSIGRNAYVGVFCCIGDVTLEDDVLIGSHVSIMNGTAQHGIERLDVPIREQPGSWPHVTIGRDTWIGDRSIVMADVGHHCVIGAGSVVTKSIPNFAIAAGVPARVIRFRTEDRDGDGNGPSQDRMIASTAAIAERTGL
jgi:acetyltransferase-like isoleucine patch superfamily enzyme